MAVTRREFIAGAATGGAGLVVGGVVGAVGLGGAEAEEPGALTGDVGAVASARGLVSDDLVRAAKTFVPPGKPQLDEYFIFSSGGHSGQLMVMGVPSMRILKIIGVFTPESWQGFGFGAENEPLILGAGTTANGGSHSAARAPLTWGDTHHPALSETDGLYDGRWVYVNDRANGRIGMVDLRDFKTKQIYDVPNLRSSHGGAFVTPNTEYLHVSTKTPTLLDGVEVETALEHYEDSFRGYSAFLAIDPETGRVDEERSFQLELPPYTQDLADMGKLVSDGWAFINSYNSEMAVGGNLHGHHPLEVGASQGDYDYLHVINWKKAEEVAATRSQIINGARVIPIDVAVEEGLLYLVREARSPHGVDVSPRGDYICVAGKLDPHVTVYSFEQIQQAIESRDFEGTDHYGIPILTLESTVAGRVEVGAGPLHTQFDDEGYAYTSIFIESAVAKFSLGAPDFSGENAFQLVEKLGVHYNIGHLLTMEGDTVAPSGKYLVGLNKWSLDRFQAVGTLYPQNFQLIELGGERMDILSDTPIGWAEPHYAQAIRADKLDPWAVYPAGTNSLTMRPDPQAIEEGGERIERDGDRVDVWMSVKRSNFKPDVINVRRGDTVTLHLTNTEASPDQIHGFAIPRYNVNVSLDPGEYAEVRFVADATGAFDMYCTEFCSALHLEMQGWFLVS